MAILSSGSFITSMLEIVKERPWQTGLCLALAICIITRVITGLQSTSKATGFQNSKSVRVVPYWLPWLGHSIQFGWGFQTFLGRVNKQHQEGAFALKLGGSTHNVITSPSMTKQILFGRYSPVNMDEFIYRVMTNFWNDHHEVRNMDHNAVFGDIHKVLTGMIRESFVTSALSKTVSMCERRMWNLVSGCESWVDHSVWERAGATKVLGSGDLGFKKKGDSFVAEVNLHPLLREFVGDIASTVLMGQNFMNNNPTALSDLWAADGKFNLFLLGLPNWFPGMMQAAAARERLVNAVADQHEAICKYLDGEDPGPEWSDLSDVSTVRLERVKEWRAANAPRGAYGPGDAAVVWALNVNANQVIFWLVWYVFGNPRLLQEIREELAPFVRLKPSTENGLPIKEAPQLEIDLQGLRYSSPLLNGAFFETMRLESGALSYKIIEEDFVVTESEEDAAILGKTAPDSYLLRKGEFVCMPHGVHQTDERYWPDYEKFDARRFWIREKNEKGIEEIKLDYGTMKVWGGGKTMCKGKKFAESEVLLFAAAFLMMWEIEPVEGSWYHPGRKITSGTSAPLKNARVRIWRREHW